MNPYLQLLISHVFTSPDPLATYRSNRFVRPANSTYDIWHVQFIVPGAAGRGFFGGDKQM